MGEDTKKPRKGHTQKLTEPVTGVVGPNGPIRPPDPEASLRDEKDRMHQTFMASEFVEWAPFARSVNLDPMASRQIFPVQQWIADKKRRIAVVQAEHIAQALFDHKASWHQDVLKTLKEYPATADAMLGILKRRMNDIIQDVNDDVEAAKKAIATGQPRPPRKFDAWETKDLSSLATAFKHVQEAKYKSLLLNDWKPKLAEEATSPVNLGAPNEGEQKKDTGWIIEIKGGQQFTTADIQGLFDRYLDKPDTVRDVSPIVEQAAQEGLDQTIVPLEDEEDA